MHDRGRPAVNRLGAGVREYVLGLVRQNFRDFGPTLPAEALLERHGVEISRVTLRKWMVGDGLWLSASSAEASISHGYDASRTASWCRSTAAITVVRGPQGALHPAGIHRRCHEQADAVALRAQREHGLLLSGAAGLPRSPWLSGSLLFRQAHRLPRVPAEANGKAERFIQSTLNECAYARTYQNSEERTSSLPAWTHQYNWHRPHAGLNQRPPISRAGFDDKNLLTHHI